MHSQTQNYLNKNNCTYNLKRQTNRDQRVTEPLNMYERIKIIPKRIIC